MHRRAAHLCLLVAAGCTAPLHDSWEVTQPARAGVTTRAIRAAPGAEVTSRDLPPPRTDPEAVAHDLEVTLLRFTARRRALSRERHGPRGRWPAPLSAAWRDVVRELEVAFAATDALPGRVLVQTRVTLEAELELSARQHGAAPADIERRVRMIYARVARQLQARRTRCATPGAPGCERAPARPRGPFVFPVSPVVVTSPYGYRRDPILGARRVRFHAGVDLGGRRGDVVVAAAPGRVVAAGWQGGHGRTVTVQHAGGYVTRYAHLSRILVTLHSEVDAGSPVGLMGSTGRSTGPHLHFEIRRGSVPIDPLQVLGRPGYATR